MREQTAWEKEMESKTKTDCELLGGGKGFIRYRFELEEFLSKECDPYEEKVFRFLYRMSYKNFYRGEGLFYTIDMKRISEGTGISEIQLKKKTMKGLEDKGLIERQKEKNKRTYTYLIKVPQTLGIHDIPLNDG